MTSTVLAYNFKLVTKPYNPRPSFINRDRRVLRLSACGRGEVKSVTLRINVIRYVLCVYAQTLSTIHL